MDKLDQLDRKILNLMQNQFPLTIRPYQELARMLNISESEVLKRVQAMKENAIIRRIGAIFNSRKMGFYSTLCACRVEEEYIDEVTAVINARNGVTHNYIRDHYYNVWFTLTAPSYEDTMAIIINMEQATGIKILSMPASKMYKIKVSLNMGDSHEN
jgi:DNA-binding Lrp family transcriptional regulator